MNNINKICQIDQHNITKIGLIIYNESNINSYEMLLLHIINILKQSQYLRYQKEIFKSFHDHSLFNDSHFAVFLELFKSDHRFTPFSKYVTKKINNPELISKFYNLDNVQHNQEVLKNLIKNPQTPVNIINEIMIKSQMAKKKDIIKAILKHNKNNFFFSNKILKGNSPELQIYWLQINNNIDNVLHNIKINDLTIVEKMHLCNSLLINKSIQKRHFRIIFSILKKHGMKKDFKDANEKNLMNAPMRIFLTHPLLPSGYIKKILHLMKKSPEDSQHFYRVFHVNLHSIKKISFFELNYYMDLLESYKFNNQFSYDPNYVKNFVKQHPNYSNLAKGILEIFDNNINPLADQEVL
jgi:hypothetical protein